MNLPKKVNKKLVEKFKELEPHLGKSMISWSQIESWNSKKGFNTGLKGKYEYIRKYFLGERYEDMGWGEFGTQVQEYIQERKHKSKFKAKERKILDTIEPLDLAEHICILDFEHFIVFGFIDDMSEDWRKIRDYKTKSESGMKKLNDGSNYQMEIYSLYVQQQKGFIPKCEYLVIERAGGRDCMMGKGRKSLSVAENVWTIPYPIDEDRLEETKKLIVETVTEISSYYNHMKAILAV